MLFSPLNIEKELIRERPAMVGDNVLISEAAKIFGDEVQREQTIKQNLKLKKSPADRIMVSPDNLDKSKLFSISQIERVCTKYRLRFLKTGYFKNDLPYEVIIKIKEVERRSGKNLHDFYIMAPAEAFDLQDGNKDPLLFANLGNNNYYLIHKWGNDLAWHRRLWSYPLRNIEALALIVLVLASLAAWLFPASFMLKREVPVDDMIVYRFFFFIWAIIAQGAALSYGLLAFHKNFSSAVWRSQYFN